MHPQIIIDSAIEFICVRSFVRIKSKFDSSDCMFATIALAESIICLPFPAAMAACAAGNLPTKPSESCLAVRSASALP